MSDRDQLACGNKKKQTRGDYRCILGHTDRCILLPGPHRRHCSCRHGLYSRRCLFRIYHHGIHCHICIWRNSKLWVSLWIKKIKRITKKNYPEFPNFLPESSMVQYFTNPIETWIYEASIDFIFTFVPVESGRTHTSVVLEVDALTGSTILTGFSQTSITLPHYFWIWGA